MSEFFSSDLWMSIVSMLPAVGGIVGMVITALLTIKKTAAAITELKNSKELAALLAELKAEREENKQLRKLYTKLELELSRIKPVGHVEDKE